MRMRAALADGPRTVKELGELGAGFVGNLGLWVDLVRVPPSGTWEHRRADRLALAESWVGPTDATEADGLAHLVRAYLRAFGPAPWKDIAGWAGISVTEARRAGEHLTLTSFRDVDGRPLVDLPGAPLPDADTPAPVRFLPHWDAALLVHARRTGILPEQHRAAIFTIAQPVLGRDRARGRPGGADLVPARGTRGGHAPGADRSSGPRRRRGRTSALERFHA